VSDVVFQHINIESFTSEPWLADDQATPNGVRYAVSGTAMISEADWDAIRSSILDNASRLDFAKIDDGNGNLLVDMDNATSSIGGPWLKITANQVIGAGVALLHFELTETTTKCDMPIVSHVWTQRMSIDPTGRMTRSVNGTVRAVRNATASDTQIPARDSASWYTYAPIADLFRRAILPEVPGPGWRRETQEFAYDQYSTALVYSIVDKQYAHDLPDGVRVGDMEFSYERTAQDAGIGVCRFSVDLEGDFNLMNLTTGSPNRKLVEAAVKLSKARINAQFNNCIITRMQITERNLLTAYSIRFELDAQVFPTSSTATSVLAPIAFMVGQKFKIKRVESRTMDPYGAFTALEASPTGCPTPPATRSSYRMVPHYIDNLISGMDCSSETAGPIKYAALTQITAGEYTDSPITIYVCPTDDGIVTSNTELSGGQYSASMEQPENTANGTQIVAHSVSTSSVNYDSGIIRMSPMYLTGADLIVQTRRPTVIVRERIEVSRANTAPQKRVRPLPSYAYLIGETWDVAFGKFDPQGNRLFVGVYERKFAMYDHGAAGGGFGTESSAYAGEIKTWSAPNGTIVPTLAPIATLTSQAHTTSVFTASVGATERYTVPAETFVP
jgi:hypothetical protein